MEELFWFYDIDDDNYKQWIDYIIKRDYIQEINKVINL